MLTVIFGAGASYDSDPDNPPGITTVPDRHRPLLANELFEARDNFITDLKRFRNASRLCRGFVT